jgi:hypothetical protein
LSYRAKESEENKINCWAVEGSPKKPSSLLDIENESLMLQQQQNLLVILICLKIVKMQIAHRFCFVFFVNRIR